MIRILQGDCLDVLKTLPDESVHCVVTSPPYWGLRDYGVAGQLGLESTPQEYVENMVAVFREIRRVLRDDGTLWLNIGDRYCANKNGNKDTLSSTLTTRSNGTRKRDVPETGRLGADRLGRDCIGIELNPKYIKMAHRRIKDDSPLFSEIEHGATPWPTATA